MTPHAAAALNSNTWPDVYGYEEHMLVRIIAYNSKKMTRDQVNNLNCSTIPILHFKFPKFVIYLSQ